MKAGKPIYAKGRKVKKKRADIENRKFLASAIGADGLQHDRCVTQVQIPYFFKVSIQDKIGVYTSGKDKGKPIYATREQISKEPFPKNWVIESCTRAVIQFTNKCSKCHTIGIPRMDKKDQTNAHYRSNKNVMPNTKKNPSKQKEQYRLIYFHKKDGKTTQCIIEKFHKGKGIFRKNGTVSQTVKALTFPGYTIEDNG